MAFRSMTFWVFIDVPSTHLQVCWAQGVSFCYCQRGRPVYGTTAVTDMTNPQTSWGGFWHVPWWME